MRGLVCATSDGPSVLFVCSVVADLAAAWLSGAER